MSSSIKNHDLSNLMGLHWPSMSSSIKNHDIRNLGGSSCTAYVQFNQEQRYPQPWWVFIDRLCQVQWRTTISAALVDLHWPPLPSSITNHDLCNFGGSSLIAYVQFNQEPWSPQPWWVFIDCLCPVQSRTTILANLLGLQWPPMSTSIKNHGLSKLGRSSLTANVQFNQEPWSLQTWWVFIYRLCPVQSRTTILANLVGLRLPPMSSSIKNHDLRNLGGSSLTAYVQFNQEPRS